MASYKGIHFDRQDIINAFEHIANYGPPSSFALQGCKYNIVYNGLAYNVKALFKIIAGNRIDKKFTSTKKLREEFKKEGFEIIEKGYNYNFIDSSIKPNFNIEKDNATSPKKIIVKKKERILLVKNFKELFNTIMNSLFSDKSREKTLEYYRNTHYSGISSENGIYVTKNAKNNDIEILNKPEISLYDKPKDKKTHNEYETGFTNKCKHISALYLYIGKADDGIKSRLEKYINYGYGGDDDHRGGYHLWFVKNNKNLYANYATITEIEEKQSELYKKANDIKQKYSKGKSISEIIEMGLICLHHLAYHYAPLANSQNQSEYKSYRIRGNSIGCTIYKEWEKYWESKLNK